jgi:hypothetical protein
MTVPCIGIGIGIGIGIIIVLVIHKAVIDGEMWYCF